MKKIFLFSVMLTFVIFVNGQLIKIQGGTSISKLNRIYFIPEIEPHFNEILVGHSIFAGVDYFDEQLSDLSR